MWRSLPDAVVPHLFAPRRAVYVLVALAAGWGMIVDGNFFPILAPTSNSTIFQSSTAACFAVLGILFGPWPGALGGLVRDGSSFVVTIAAHPGMVADPSFLGWTVRKAADIFEDVVLGWIPGLVGLRTRRVSPLVLSAVAAAWLSLPFLVVVNTLVAGHPGSIGTALMTPVGDWDEPADPGLTVYALLTGAMTAFALVPAVTRKRSAIGLGLGLALAGVGLIALGAHP